MSHDTPRAMLVNVGRAVAAVVHNLNELQPPFICFFVSEQTRPFIRDIRTRLNYEPEHHDWILTPAPQNLLSCYQIISEELPRILEKWAVRQDELGVDYTAGTKPMSVAAVLATIEHSSQYFYVGAVDPSGRDKDGIGVVLDGRESTWYQTNPWEALAVPARKEIALLFNLGRFADARDRAEHLSKVVPSEMQDVYKALAEMIEGYALWDRFEYKDAQMRIYRALERLKMYVAGRDDPLHGTLDRVAENAEFLRQLIKKGEAAARLDSLDMIANATRRVRARRYDDGVARLYSVLESLARNRLIYGYKIKTGSVRPDQIPEAIREDFVQQYHDPDDASGVLRLGLKASYHLLEALGDELGAAYYRHEKELNKVLHARNQSRLAHGTQPVRPEVYKTMYGIVMAFAGIADNDLPAFPELRL